MGNWIKLLGIASACAFPIGVALYRLGALEVGTSFKLIQAGAAVGALVFLVGLVYFFVQRGENPMAAKSAIIGAIIGLIPVLPLAMQAKKAKSLPFIHNISTDTVAAPEFDKVLALRNENHNPIAYTAEIAKLQTPGYPNIKTLMTDMSVADAHAKATNIVESFGWELVNADAQTGIIEATDTTLLWAFKDDVVIRVMAKGDKTAVDLRSVSRIGGSDLGANAARIEKFLTEFSK